MSYYNQRKKREALRRLSQGRTHTTDSAAQELKSMKRSLHQRALTDHEIHRKSRPSSPSPLERSEVQSSSSSPGLFGKPAASSSSSALFGKPSTSGFATSQGDPLSASATPSVGLFGKEQGSSVFSSGSGGSGTQTTGNFGFQSGGTLFGKTQFGSDSGKSSFKSLNQDSAPVIKTLFGKPIVMSEPSSTTTTSPGQEKGLFGKTEPTSSAVHPVPKNKMLFGKPASVSPALVNEGRGKPAAEGLFGKGRKIESHQWSGKGAPSKENGSASKRPLIEMEEGDTGREQDLSDLETFGNFRRAGTERDDASKKAVIQRRGLFGKALDEAQGKKRRSEDEHEAKRHRVSVTEHHRTASPEEIRKITSIVCKDIPPELNLRGILVDIFQEHGEVTKVSCHPETRSAIIYFADHSSASRAKRKVKSLKRGTPPVAIYWASKQTKGSKSERGKPRTDVSTRSPVRAEAVKERVSVSPSKRTISRREESSTSSSSQPKTTVKTAASLQALEGRIANTASDRLELLEERDRLIREERTMKQGVVPVLRAECEDMCPEKERYMREFQRRLSVYEVENVSAREQKVSHPSAVKEYSRSSADQELPLPSDLRPPPILDMTMNYLMNNIMDKQLNRDENLSWGEWYNFLWDRTRSIRKDITQQQLCDLTAVDLLEKCTRFHVFCAHRLCEEDIGTFDPKINTENLTKCLQSLKHLYDDLTEKGVACKNEVEFRGYDVLLNLNQGDILRQVQTFRDGVRNSESMRFAVQCVSAISSQNYVKFFKLLKSASFLNACIMHRYFTQVRNLALEIINKAFSTNRGSAYPLSEVMRLLAFENEKQTTKFCSAHGLNVLNGYVQLNKSEFFQPDYLIPVVRSVSIIEEKSNSLIGEVVNGGPLPPNLRHLPSSSFDGKGRFSLTKIKSSEGGTAENRHEEREEEEVTPLSQPSTSTGGHLPSEEQIKSVGVDVVNEVIHEFAESISLAVLDDSRHADEVLEVIARDVLEETLAPMVLACSREALKDAKDEDDRRSEIERLRRERIVMERERMTKEMSSEVFNSILEGVLQSEIKSMVLMEKSLLEEERRVEQLKRVATELSEECLNSAVTAFSEQIAREVYEEELRIRDEALAEIEAAVHLLQQARYLKIWRRVFAKKLRLKDTIETFPAGPSTDDIADQLKEFSWLGKSEHVRNESSSVQRIYDRQRDVAVRILKHHRERYLFSKALWSPLDLPELLGQSLTDVHSPSSHLFWKLVVSLPSSSESEEFALFSSWLKSKLTRGYIPEQMKKNSLDEGIEIETCSLYNSKLIGNRASLSVCTKIISGTLPSSSGSQRTARLVREALLGTQAFIMVLDIQGCHGNHKSYWEGQSRRLFRLLSSKPRSPRVPLLVYSVGEDMPPAWITKCQSSLNIAALQVEGYVSEVYFQTFSGNVRQSDIVETVYHTEYKNPVVFGGGQRSFGVNRSQTVKTMYTRYLKKVRIDLRWLAERCPPTPSLESATVAEYLDVGLTNFFSLQIRENESRRRKAKISEEGFDVVICLYNSVIEHLTQCSSGSRLKSISWPPTEIRREELPPPEWNDPSTLADLREVLMSLQLPAMGDCPSDSWEDTKERCLMYIKSLPGSPHEKVALISRVQLLLLRCERDFEAYCKDNYQIPGCTPRDKVLPWTNLAESCIDYMVALLKKTKDGDEDSVGDRMVYYFQSDFDNFRPPEKWLQSASDTLGEMVTRPESISETYLMSVEGRQDQINSDQARQTQEDEGASTKSEEISFVDVPEDLLQQRGTNLSEVRLTKLLISEKEESQRFDEYLKNVLEDSPLLFPPSTDRGRAPISREDRDEDPLLEDRIKKLEAELESARRTCSMDRLRLETVLSL